MVSPSRFTFLLLTVMCGALLCGCLPPGGRDQDEEKEPHFLAGRNRVNQMDFKGAIEAFTRALEVNPRSAKAHFELGWLYEEKDPDPAAAIYHYEQYLKLRPAAENAGTVRQRILGLKQELAKTVLPMPSTPSLQRDLEQLAEQNRRLHEELQECRVRYAALTTNRLQISNPSPAPRVAQKAAPSESQPITTNPSPATAMRTHKVQSGESPSSIARKYGVKVDALMSANPGLNPKRPQVGQVVNIPPS